MSRLYLRMSGYNLALGYEQDELWTLKMWITNTNNSQSIYKLP